MKHSLMTPEDCNCDRPHCPICEGGLGFCMVCKGAEGSLPSECPGRIMTAEEEELVYAGQLDFKDGSWLYNYMGKEAQ